MTVLPFRRRRRPTGAPEPACLAPAPAGEPLPGDAIVFSGGGSLGAAQVGALRALAEAGIAPDLVVGCSVGALNAAFFAVDPTPTRIGVLAAVWEQLGRQMIFPGGRLTVARRLLRRRAHLYSPRGLVELIDATVPLADLADTAIPCHVVTTDLQTGRPCWWDAGDPREVLRASACLPGIFPPVPLGDGLHVDGAVTCPVPVQRALDLGAQRVWVLDVSSQFHGWGDARMSALDVLLESFAISRSHIANQRPFVAPDQQVHRLPPLGVGRHDLRDFSRTPTLLALGYEAGRQMLAGYSTSASSLASRETPSTRSSSLSA